MYLTKNEFIVLSEIKLKLTNAEIKTKFKLNETDIKKNKINLFEKYGVSPDCRNLYDALKMRYKDLNLPAYEVKDIK